MHGALHTCLPYADYILFKYDINLPIIKTEHIIMKILGLKPDGSA